VKAGFPSQCRRLRAGTATHILNSCRQHPFCPGPPDDCPFSIDRISIASHVPPRSQRKDVSRSYDDCSIPPLRHAIRIQAVPVYEPGAAQLLPTLGWSDKDAACLQVSSSRSHVALLFFRSSFPSNQVSFDVADTLFPVLPHVTHPHDADVHPPFQAPSSTFA
jgi:hypothetical protein